jgi:8-oxo-dGTP pyrophosphatase MutT (NUDIX family)
MEEFANPLTAFVVLVAVDGQIVLEKGNRIYARRRKYHVIAGFMERELDALDNHPNPFATLKREVREELGLILDSPLHVTGLVRAVWGSELCFYRRLPISFEHLLETKTIAETDCEIDLLQAVEDSPSAVASFLVCHTIDLVPSGRACLFLYGREAHGDSLSGLRFAEGAIPRLPAMAGPRSERISPKRLLPTTTSNRSGCSTN